MKKNILITAIAILSVFFTTNCQTHNEKLNTINTFLKTFDNGYYGYLSVDSQYLYDNYKGGKQSKIPISEISEARIVTPNREVEIFCKEGNCCIGITGEKYDGMPFSSHTDFDTNRFVKNLNSLINSLKK